MRALVWQGAYDVKLTEVDDPVLLQPTDAIIRVSMTSICGTDLHPYRGHMHDFMENTIMGHEFVGIVECVGSEVSLIKAGDRVVASDLIACGHCLACKKGSHYHCSHASLFGYGEVVGRYSPGGQAEKVRIPYADTVLLKIPETITNEDALFVGDILTTGFVCAEEASIQEGDVVAVIGGGPVGLMCAMCARLFKASDIFVIEPDEGRGKFIEHMGFTALKPNELHQIYDSTGGRGVDVVLEAVGVDETLQTALDIVAARGNIVCVGAHHSLAFPFNVQQAFAKEITLKFAVGNPIKYGKRVFELIEQGEIKPSQIITHRLQLEEIVEAYQLFDLKRAFKIVLMV